MNQQDVALPTLDELLGASAATPAFAEAVRALKATNRATQALAFNAASPPVKALRAVMQLLESEPTLAIDRVAINGSAGCSDYRGDMTVTTAAWSTYSNKDRICASDSWLHAGTES